eukprot:13088418-Ditylum_brightwellii.AAC.1
MIKEDEEKLSSVEVAKKIIETASTDNKKDALGKEEPLKDPKTPSVFSAALNKSNPIEVEKKIIETASAVSPLANKNSPLSYVVCNGLTNQLLGHASYISAAVESKQDIIVPDVFITNGVNNEKAGNHAT